ncbi:hypothetical protein Nocox_27610 [Nonomuraea coxensis DSM 45129]|uniref:Uncharacterized protein n=1 Tax=Nonomuraea coxensis DSM 45129 TaxID=1122611 RepID=A0ABX8U645_9ACTN|nr:hypothetical protein [Nonomuraea coxensis]QYC43118.1 hypothetical protein Nocox_27610 [Nonomuraea coxensis DSM 45129]
MSGAMVLGMPWWAYLIGSVAWLLAYICRQLVLLLLASKALDKAEARHVPAVMTVIFPGRQPAAGEDEPAPGELPSALAADGAATGEDGAGPA